MGWPRVIGSPGAFRLTNVEFGGVVVVGTFLRFGPRRGLTATELGARVDSRDLRIPCMASRLELREDFPREGKEPGASVSTAISCGAARHRGGGAGSGSHILQLACL